MARGNIRKITRVKGAVYEVRVDIGGGGAGEKRRQRSKTFRTRKEAQQALTAWLADIDKGVVVERTTRTLNSVLDDWLAMEVQHNVRGYTYQHYEQVIRTHIRPALGATPVQKLTAERVQRFYAELLAAGQSVHLVSRVHARLKQALSFAVRLGMVPRNVTDAVRPPRYRAPEMDTWTLDEVTQFLATTRRLSLYGPIWTLSLTTGLRKGELLGLRWADVDLDAGILRVRRTITRYKGTDGRYTPQVGEPKTASSRRTVSLPAFAVSELRAHRAAQLARRLELGPIWTDHDLVFTSAVGTPIIDANLYRDYTRLVAAAGVRRIRVHDHRHTHATLVLAQGGSIKALSERLGHRGGAVTMNVYAHVAPHQPEEMAARLDAALAPHPTDDDDSASDDASEGQK